MVARAMKMRSLGEDDQWGQNTIESISRFALFFRDGAAGGFNQCSGHVRQEWLGGPGICGVDAEGAMAGRRIGE
jgi:hypothetical protein